jgi:hypothetical protein
VAGRSGPNERVRCNVFGMAFFFLLVGDWEHLRSALHGDAVYMDGYCTIEFVQKNRVASGTCLASDECFHHFLSNMPRA